MEKELRVCHNSKYEIMTYGHGDIAFEWNFALYKHQ